MTLQAGVDSLTSNRTHDDKDLHIATRLVKQTNLVIVFCRIHFISCLSVKTFETFSRVI